MYVASAFRRTCASWASATDTYPFRHASGRSPNRRGHFVIDVTDVVKRYGVTPVLNGATFASPRADEMCHVPPYGFAITTVVPSLLPSTS